MFSFKLDLGQVIVINVVFLKDQHLGHFLNHKRGSDVLNTQ